MGAASGVRYKSNFRPLGSPSFVAVRNREAFVSRRLTMYYSGSDFNPCHRICRGCPPLGGSVMGGSTVSRYHLRGNGPI